MPMSAHQSSAASVIFPAVSHSHSLPPKKTLQYKHVGLSQSLMRSLLYSLSLGACWTLWVPSKNGVSVSPVLWNSCNQTLLAFKIIISGGSSSSCQAPSLQSLTWRSRLSLLWENFCGISIFLFMSHPPRRCEILFYHDHTSPTVLLWLLCLGYKKSFLSMVVQQLVVVLVSL